VSLRVQPLPLLLSLSPLTVHERAPPTTLSPGTWPSAPAVVVAGRQLEWLSALPLDSFDNVTAAVGPLCVFVAHDALSRRFSSPALAAGNAQLQCAVPPALSPGVYDVSVTVGPTRLAQASPLSLTVLPALTVSALAPDSAPLSGSTAVTVFGSGFAVH